jgi:hypothetical protein
LNDDISFLSFVEKIGIIEREAKRLLHPRSLSYPQLQPLNRVVRPAGETEGVAGGDVPGAGKVGAGCKNTRAAIKL